MRSSCIITVLLTTFLVSSLSAQSQPPVLSSVLTNAGDGKTIPVREWFADLARRHGMALDDRLPSGYALMLPRLWNVGDTLGHILGSACLLAGDLVYTIEDSRLILKKNDGATRLSDLPGQRSSRPLQKNDLLLSVGPFFPMSNGFDLYLPPSDKRYEKILYNDVSLRLDWMFATHFSLSGLLAFSEISMQMYRIDTGAQESEQRVETSLAVLGINYWINPQRDLGIFPGLAPFGELDLAFGLYAGIMHAVPDGSMYVIVLPENPPTALDGDFFLTMFHFGISYNIAGRLYIRLDWYTGRIEKIFESGIGDDFVNSLGLSFVIRY